MLALAVEGAYGLESRDISDNYLIANQNVNKKVPPAKTPKLPKVLDPCTVVNPATNGFFDLRQLSSIGAEEGVVPSWNARGWDYGMNFTLGICSTPLKKLQLNPEDFTEVTNSSLVGGYYTDEIGVKYSIGEFSTEPMFRGRKLTLRYENGSYCKLSRNGELVRKSTILSFACDRTIMSKAQISFVGASNDCDYFFEVRTVHACPTAAKSDNLALVWIFALILLAALFVFCGAGTLYRRFGRRGWRPLPSYGIMHNIKSMVSVSSQ